MKNLLIILSLLVISVSSCVKDRVSTVPTGPVVVGDRKLIHYWSFNFGVDSSTLAIPDTTIGGGTISFSFASAGYADAVAGSNLNKRMNLDSGTAMRVRNPFHSWVLHIPTTGFKQPIIQFAVQKSGSGPASNALSYTTDGNNYTTTGLSATSITFSADWTQYSLDFSSIAEVNDNPKFAIKFSNSDTTAGNDRYDNITVDAYIK